ncbi:MAG: SPASM domain-containing protein [Methanolobus sp.]|nr:SPASM domain-containing protein [Methanolobus sp.]
MCTGNQSALLILPNGDVTLCEKSYFNKNLTIGNILENSIMDVWDSERAKNLFFIPQSSFPEESACSKCAEFEDCRYNLGVCWTDVMASYGEESWLYPSPNCPFAPQPKYITYCE